MIPMTNSGSMPIKAGDAGPSTATSSNQSGQSIGAINMGGGVSPWLIAGVVLVIAVVILKK